MAAEALRLIRRIEAQIGGTTLRICDRVENIGRELQRHALLYHVNLGYPAIAPGATVSFQGETVTGPLAAPDDKAIPEAHSHAVRNLPAHCGETLQCQRSNSDCREPPLPTGRHGKAAPRARTTSTPILARVSPLVEDAMKESAHVGHCRRPQWYSNHGLTPGQ